MKPLLDCPLCDHFMDQRGAEFVCPTCKSVFRPKKGSTWVAAKLMEKSGKMKELTTPPEPPPKARSKPLKDMTLDELYELEAKYTATVGGHR